MVSPLNVTVYSSFFASLVQFSIYESNRAQQLKFRSQIVELKQCW